MCYNQDMKKILIEDISYEGAGVGRVDGKVVFVPKTLVGETVEVEIVKENSKFAQGKVVNIVKACAKRCEPKCPYFEKCGGCDFQHCSYEQEIEIKRNILKREFSKIGFNDEIEFVESKDRFGYRNKIKLEVRSGKLGYFKAKSNEFFEIDCCPLATEQINKTIKTVSEYLKVVEYKTLKHVYIKQVDDNIGICFLFDKNSQKYGIKFKKNEKLSDYSIFFAYGEVLESNKTKVSCVQGEEKLIKKYDEYDFEIDISAFNQINDDVAKKMYAYVLQNAKGMRVVNAYSGQGLLTALLSKYVKFVYGIEYQFSAHEAAEKLTEQLSNVENICGRVEEKISQVLLRDRIDMIILDPAREGCTKIVLDAINAKNIERLIYISCNFSTIVRDLAVLKDFYNIEKIKIFDMFPNTTNMETVVFLQRK